MAKTRHVPTAAELKAGERRIQVMKLRVEGMDVPSIAAAMGMTRKLVRADLRKVAQSQQAEAAGWNAVLIERNELIWRKLLSGVEKGDLWTIDRAFQYMDRQITLTGADKVAQDSGAEVDKWLTGSVQAGDDFEDLEEEILSTVVDEFDDLEPESLEEQLDTPTAARVQPSRVRSRAR